MKTAIFLMTAIALCCTGADAGAAICPDGSFVAGNTCQITPSGKYVSGEAPVQIAPNGGYVSGTPQITPGGGYVGGAGQPTLCPDGSYVAGSCHLQPNGHYTGN